MAISEKEVTKYMISDAGSAESLEAAKKVVQDVNKGSAQENLLQLIQALGEYLTGDDEFVRSKATGLLSNTLNECHQESINESAVSVLVEFYCDRLSDKTCVQTLLEGLAALTQFPNFTDTNAASLAKRLIQSVELQQFPQGTRNSGYKVYENLLSTHMTALKSMNDEFIYGFTKAMDGEKDPRNLMSAFEIVHLISENFDISTHVEDIFEVTFCYFPITFKPPPDDPYGITSDDLKSSLRKCLASNAQFAKFALPLILEKLSSTSGSAKKDSMETLAACAPVYGPQALLSNINDIFNYLKLEVFHSTEIALEDVAVESIRSVVATLGTGTSSTDFDPTQKALKSLVEECATNLKDPDMKDSKQTGRILRAVASASDPASHYVVDMIIPLLLKQYRETTVATLRKSNLDVIIELLEACRTLYGSSNEEKVKDDLHSPMLQYKDRFFGIFEGALGASNEYNLLRLSGLTGLKSMILSSDYLASNEVGLAVQSLNNILLEESDDELRQASIKSAALDALYVTSAIDSKYITGLTIPALIDRLPQESPKSNTYSQTLFALRTLSPVPSVYKAAIGLFISKFDSVCEKDNEANYACAIINSIVDIVKTKSDENHKDLTAGITSIVPHFIKQTIDAALNPDKNQLILDQSILRPIALIITYILTKLDSSAQRDFLDRSFKLFVQGDLSEIGSTSNQPFEPLKSTASLEQQKTSQIFASIIASLRKDVALPVDSIQNYLDTLIKLALDTKSDIQVTSVSIIIGSVVNKWKDNASMSQYVKAAAASLEDTISYNAESRENALEVYLWITKALALRAHALGYELTNNIISWCGSRAIGVQAPRGFDILIGDSEIALNKLTFATSTILYKQRFFSFCLPKLVAGFESSESDIKPNYLIALSYVLKNVPKQILLNELPPLVPLLIQSLSLPDAALKVSTLETFKLAVSDAADIVSPQIRTILPPLLELLKNNPIAVRVAALTCLAQFPSYIPNDSLAPHVNFVLKQLKEPLDDKKRIVRKEAVDCRSKWYTINLS